ncbi:Uma2 family endonuclease [Singulisphaera rosea]
MATTTALHVDPEPQAAPFLFQDVSWEDYEAMLRIVGDGPVRVTYDLGRMELVSPTYRHENVGYLLGRLVDILAEELDIAIEGAGTTTFKRPDLSKGVEPDQCYWLRENARRMCDKAQLDLAVDPPPDLVVQVDISSGSLPRIRIFGAIGIPEVWRYDGTSLQFLHLQDDGAYHSADTSWCFPALTLGEAREFLEKAKGIDKTAWSRSVRASIRASIVPGAGERP